MILESTHGRESADGSSSGGAVVQDDGLRGHSSKPTGISDPTQTAAVAADGVQERRLQEGKQTDRQTEFGIYCRHQEAGMGQMFDWQGQSR